MRFFLKACFGFILTYLVFSLQDVVGQTNFKNSASANITLGVTEVSLIRVSSPLISLNLKQREAGLSIETSKTDSSARLYLSSLITAEYRSLSAKISSGSIPRGTILQLSALPPSANFVGSWGMLAPIITLDNTDRVFVNNIASCYSGTSADDGYVLKFIYKLDPDNSTYSELRATSGTSVIVTLTLSELK